MGYWNSDVPIQSKLCHRSLSLGIHWDSNYVDVEEFSGAPCNFDVVSNSMDLGDFRCCHSMVLEHFLGDSCMDLEYLLGDRCLDLEHILGDCCLDLEYFLGHC